MKKLVGLLLLGLLTVSVLIGCTSTTMEVDVGPLLVTNNEIVAGESFIVEAGITNMGDNVGTFTANLMLDGKIFEEKKVSIAAGATEMVQFDCIAKTPGTHTLKLEDSSATFTALKPAVFEVAFVPIPAEVYMKQATVIEVNITNIGEVEGIYNGRLTVDGTEKASHDTPIAPGATETITLSITKNTPGTYTISLGETTATLTVFLAFPDLNLEAVIREAINKPEGPIDISDLESITTLNAQNRGISDITGLEYCVNLQMIRLQHNNIRNISPLASLTNLNNLKLDNNNIVNITPLTNLTRLEDLRLEQNNISDISPLLNLINLWGISLHNNNISDISPLASLTNLQTLEFAVNNINDISALASLTNLKNIGLDANNISDISPLIENSGLGEGDEVYLRDNNLDLTEGSEDMQNIIILQGRGVEVQY